jgi:hypothetical protein
MNTTTTTNLNDGGNDIVDMYEDAGLLIDDLEGGNQPRMHMQLQRRG